MKEDREQTWDEWAETESERMHEVIDVMYAKKPVDDSGASGAAPYPKEAPTDAIWDARETLGVPRTVILGLQHLFAMFGATILVPILVNGYFEGAGFNVQLALLTAGCGTLLFHWITGWGVPAFLGSSFAFLSGWATVAALDSGIFATMSMSEKMQYASGGIVVAGALYPVLGLLMKLLGAERVMRFLPTQVTAPIVACIGIGLMPSAIQNCSANWPLAFVAIVAIVFFMMLPSTIKAWNRRIGQPNKPVGSAAKFLSLLPILLAVVIAYIVALIMQASGGMNADGSVIVNGAAISSAAWVGLPEIKLAKFNFTAIMVMAPIAISTMMEHIGDINAISDETRRPFTKNPGLWRTLMGDGIATMFAAALGSAANTTYGENTGVLTMTKVYDPKVVRLAAIFAVALGFLPKISGIFGTMPTAIVGGISIVLYCNISVIGFRNLQKNEVDFTNMRDVFLVGTIVGVFIGVKFCPSLDQFFTGDGNLTFGEFKLSALAAASVWGIFWNAILPGKPDTFGKNPEADANRGIVMSQTMKQFEETE